MQPPDPPTPLELRLLEAHQMLHAVRMQTTLLHEGTMRCVDKCMDTDELFTLARTHQPISQRLKLDEKERSCVQTCSGKWDAIYMREAQRLVRTEQDMRTMEMMVKNMEAMAAHAGGK
jgi:hypothetical protein